MIIRLDSLSFKLSSSKRFEGSISTHSDFYLFFSMTHCAKRYKNSVDKKSEHFFEKRSNIKELTIHKINEVIESMKYYHRDSRVIMDISSLSHPQAHKFFSK